MTDTYIDQHEPLSYGPFAVTQIKAHVIGLEPAIDGALGAIVGRLTSAGEAMQKALSKAGDVDGTTYASGKADADPVGAARDVMRRVVRYAESRPDGDALAAKILDGEALSTVIRRRPAKLLGALQHAIDTVGANKAKLAEHKAWTAELTAAHLALGALDKKVRTSRIGRRAMTPEVKAAREAWLVVYGAAKLIVEGVLRLQGKVALLPEIFDDLAEVHRAPGVTDGGAPAEPVAPEPPKPA